MFDLYIKNVDIIVTSQKQVEKSQIVQHFKPSRYIKASNSGIY